MRFKIGFTLAAIASVAIAPVAASAHDNGYRHYHQNSNGDQQLVGGAIGAVTGAVIGSQLAASGARTEGSVLGAVIGGVAGAAIAGDGRSSVRYNNGGYYNQNTGYYGGYAQPIRSTTYYNNSGYYQPNYRTHHTTTYVQPRVVYHAPYYPRTYYSPPRTSVFINVGGNRGYNRHRGYRNRGHNVRRVRHHRRHR